ncbi:hypothetical protein DNA98_12940 [Meiothermus sp. Pnk-1]|nr:hypothetical protein DNA98_12940 [Meiothermus sp. Pnk-1]
MFARLAEAAPGAVSESMSSYIRNGRRWPRQSIEAMARARGMEPVDLLAWAVEAKCTWQGRGLRQFLAGLAEYALGLESHGLAYATPYQWRSYSNIPRYSSLLKLARSAGHSGVAELIKAVLEGPEPQPR